MYSRTAFVALCLFTAYALFRPAPWPLPAHLPNLDKVAHFALFLTLSCSSYFAFVPANRVAHQLLPLLFLAGISEWLQEVFLPARHFSLGDFHANVIGILAGFLLCFLFRRKNRHSVTV